MRHAETYRALTVLAAYDHQSRSRADARVVPLRPPCRARNPSRTMHAEGTNGSSV